MSGARRKRQLRPRSTGPSVVLSASTAAENASTNTVIGALFVANHPSGSSGWTFAITSQTPSGKLNISSANLRTNAALDYEANPTLSVTITASKSAQSDIVQVFAITVTNVLEVTLGALTFSDTTFLIASSSGGTINGATSGSTIGASGLPTGLTINGPARTWAWAGGGSASSGSFTLTEMHADGSNSPRASTINWTITDIPDGTLTDDAGAYLLDDAGAYLLAA